MAASGNVVSDIIAYFKDIDYESDSFLRLSQITTLAIGVGALLMASFMTNVLQLMLYSYAFMVSGLFVPIIGAFYWDKSSSAGAMAAMIVGGGTTVSLEIFANHLPAGLDANVFGITASAIAFVALSLLFPDAEEATQQDSPKLETVNTVSN
jgi:SSS family solute:Na+ symporter